jgi:prefoldin subunit 5
MKKSSSILLLSLLALSAFLVIIPVAVHATITGTPILAANEFPDGSGLDLLANGASPYTINVTAGTSLVSAVDYPLYTGTPLGYFEITTSGVTFSGANIYLYLSMNGNAEINNALGDVFYAGPFPAVDLVHSPPLGFTSKGVLSPTACAADPTSCYWVGTDFSGHPGITGAIPININASYQFEKLYDGSCGAPTTAPSFSCTGTGVAGAKETLNILPGIILTPTTGPAGLMVEVEGGGFTAGQHVNITYQYSYTNWHGVTSAKHGTWVSGIIAISSPSAGTEGTFTKTAPMLDTKQPYDTAAGATVDSGTVPILFAAYQPGHISTQVLLDPIEYASNLPVYTEIDRVFNQISSYFQGANVEIDPVGVYGNDTTTSGANDLSPYGSTSLSNVPLDVYVTGSIGINGSYTYAGANVTVTISGHTGTVGSTVSSTSTGAYILNVTVPTDLVIGLHIVSVTDKGVTYTFKINVLPTLLLTPDKGSPSNPDTQVTAAGYGFPADAAVWIYWQHLNYADNVALNVANATTSAGGSFTGVTFLVPDPTYGGTHLINAIDNITSAEPFPGATTTISDAASDATASSPFTVTTTLVVTPNSVNANTKGFMNGTLEGLQPFTEYDVQVDNAVFSYLLTPGTGFNGNGQVNFTSTGFRPGWHQVELVCDLLSIFNCSNTNVSAPQAFGYFNVTTTGDYISTQISGFTSAINSLQSSVNSLSSSLSTFESSVTASLSTITSDVSGLGAQLTSIQGSITTLTTNVATLQSDVTSIQSSLTSISSTVQQAAASAATAATQATNAANNANAAVSGNSTSQLYVLVVAVLAAITLVLELAILVRKLS